MNNNRAARVGPKFIAPGAIDHSKKIDASKRSIENWKIPADIRTLKVPQDVLTSMGSSNWMTFNPSVTVWHGQLMIAIRVCHPRLWIAGGGRANVIGRISETFELTECAPMAGVDYEDLRLIAWPDGQLGAIGGFAVPGKDAVLSILKFGGDGSLHTAKMQTGSRTEKNWMPCVMPDGHVKFIYRCQPLVVMAYDEDKGLVSPSPGIAAKNAGSQPRVGDGPRGSSQLIPYEGGYIACIHERPTNDIIYYHRLVRFNADLTICVVGKQFVFEHFGIEFCCGLAHWNGKWIFSYGYEDKACRLAICEDDAIWAFTPEPTWDVIKSESQTAPILPDPSKIPGLETVLCRASTPPIQSLPGWCTEQKARRLVELIVNEKPKVCVELGVFGGRSLLPIALALQFNGEGHIDGFDPYTKEAALEGMNDAANTTYWSRMPYAEIHKTAVNALTIEGVQDFAKITKVKSCDVVNTYADGTIDFLHQDSNHSEEISVSEVRAWLPKLRTGGLWVFDDTDWVTTQTAQFLLREAGCIKVEDYRHWAVYRKG